MNRWKTVIGSKLKARNFSHQKTEVKIGTNILNKMTELEPSRVRSRRMTRAMGKGII